LDAPSKGVALTSPTFSFAGLKAAKGFTFAI